MEFGSAVLNDIWGFYTAADAGALVMRLLSRDAERGMAAMSRAAE